MTDFWPFRRRRTTERVPLISELEEQRRADAAKKLSAEALQRTIARGKYVTENSTRQLELRRQNSFGEMFEESMRRKIEGG